MSTVGIVQLVAMVKPFRVRAVLEALAPLEIQSATVREVMGFGRQKEQLHRYLGSEFDGAFIPKVELSLFLPENQVESAIRTIVTHARTGRMGDGKILVIPCSADYVSW